MEEQLKQPDAEIKDLSQAVETAGGDPKLLYHVLLLRAGTYSQMHKPDLALQDVTRAIALDAKAPQAYAARALLEQAGGQTSAEIADDSKAISLDPRYQPAYEDRAIAYGNAHKYAEAAADEGQLLKLRPNSAPDLNNRCWFLALDGKLSEALSDCQQALSLNAGDAATQDSTGYVYLKLKDAKRAIAAYDQALKLDLHLASSLYGRGLAEQEEGDQDASKADLALARQYDPHIEQEFGS